LDLTTDYLAEHQFTSVSIRNPKSKIKFAPSDSIIRTSYPRRRRKVPDSGRGVHLHDGTFPGIFHGRSELRVGSADEMGNHGVYMPGTVPGML
jgi:hypothetical protein